MDQQDAPLWAEKLLKDTAELKKRMVRVETRATNALRAMGFIPNEDPSEQRPSKAVFDGHSLVVTGLDVQVRDLARAAVMSGEYGDIPIYYNNHQLGVIHVHHTIRSEARDD